eukprot:COSAG01_NODE_1311_length_10774_cov_18.218299_7_plen_172_part_00
MRTPRHRAAQQSWETSGVSTWLAGMVTRQAAGLRVGSWPPALTWRHIRLSIAHRCRQHCTAASAASAAPAPARSRGGGERGLEVGAGDVRPPSCVLMVIQASGRVVGGAARAMLLAQAATLSLPAEIIWEISNPGGGCGSHSGSISALSPGSTQEGGTFPCGASTNQTYGV